MRKTRGRLIIFDLPTYSWMCMSVCYTSCVLDVFFMVVKFVTHYGVWPFKYISQKNTITKVYFVYKDFLTIFNYLIYGPDIKVTITSLCQAEHWECLSLKRKYVDMLRSYYYISTIWYTVQTLYCVHTFDLFMTQGENSFCFS